MCTFRTSPHSSGYNSTSKPWLHSGNPRLVLPTPVPETQRPRNYEKSSQNANMPTSDATFACAWMRWHRINAIHARYVHTHVVTASRRCIYIHMANVYVCKYTVTVRPLLISHDHCIAHVWLQWGWFNVNRVRAVHGNSPQTPRWRCYGRHGSDPQPTSGHLKCQNMAYTHKYGGEALQTQTHTSFISNWVWWCSKSTPRFCDAHCAMCTFSK